MVDRVSDCHRKVRVFTINTTVRPSLLMLRQSNNDGDISSLAFSPKANFIAYTTSGGSFVRWSSPIATHQPDPVKSEEATAKALDKLLDDDFGDDFEDDLEDKGEDLDDAVDVADDWIVDDDGAYAADDGERFRSGRTEVGRFILVRSKGGSDH